MTHPDPIIIGLAGRAGAGKDTAAERLCSRFGFVRVAFADALKEMLAALCEHVGADHAHLHEPALKAQPIPQLGQHTARVLMQTLGTEWGRNQLGPTFWLDVLAQHTGIATGFPVHDRIVVADVRYANEAAWVRQHGGQVIRLVRRQAAAVHPHSSEDDIDALDADTELHNHGSLLALNDLIDGAMATLGVAARRPLED